MDGSSRSQREVGGSQWSDTLIKTALRQRNAAILINMDGCVFGMIGKYCAGGDFIYQS